ncbi:COP9 signalosome complex subunit 5b-like [Impatiens glandulifera]|uniref:COP9 signalosome complex subunit 5b-like n=1 Tax=Impatiens glandulifera TaxID=253017 RepID=UPI001FB0EB47|nr:COP9 signalosome complex subunit 5b-like [Impatiens glandulifera]XP_047332903.1 COP9 signalosome complex subunit 5b-like [Impatiens glandulifera]
MSDLAEKLEQAENYLSHSRFGPLITLSFSRKKEEENKLAKITKDNAKITVEQIHKLMSQVLTLGNNVDRTAVIYQCIVILVGRMDRFEL